MVMSYAPCKLCNGTLAWCLFPSGKPDQGFVLGYRRRPYEARA